MSEKKIEVLFNEAVAVGNLLEKNLWQFDKSNQAIMSVYSNIEQLTQTIKQISLYSQKIKQEEAQKFSSEIKEQVDRYYTALQDLSLDTSDIEKLITKYNTTVMKQINRLGESADTISQTLQKNGDAIIAAAGMLNRSKIGVMWSTTVFGIGVVTGALFLSAYPIVQATKTFYAELKERDQSIQALKEQYETNNKALKFLSKHNITIHHTVTDDSWDKRSLRSAPIVLFPKNIVLQTDTTNEYQRIIFKKTGDR